MDGCKLYCFIYFVVAMGLVTRSRGQLFLPVLEDTTHATYAPEATSKVNDTAPTEMKKTSGPEPSTTAPKRTTIVHSTVTPKVKICIAWFEIGKDQTGQLLILVGLLGIVCILLLVVAAVLACKLCYLRGQVRGSYPTRSNGAGNWDASQGDKEVAGTGGEETSVMLEEVKLVKDEEAAQPGVQGAADKAGNSGEGDAGSAKEPNGGSTAAAPASEPAPATEPEPEESPSPQTSRPTASEPAMDNA
ncbi:skin secretory protein xP2-like [Conger conger]|uniref:skin secretory protein xP2-like n=1 Tax=Conger conger TaxID=82655 RepID=UPI002A59CB2A|nr:skin secretory protein xP2-like [Conger conger]